MYTNSTRRNDSAYITIELIRRSEFSGELDYTNSKHIKARYFCQTLNYDFGQVPGTNVWIDLRESSVTSYISWHDTDAWILFHLNKDQTHFLIN